jgi:hypothetical protein
LRVSFIDTAHISWSRFVSTRAFPGDDTDIMFSLNQKKTKKKKKNKHEMAPFRTDAEAYTLLKNCGYKS